ncbi:MAG: hypothetical protein ONA90_02340, partial [candidate division KSB1 bacterium]|nr:hypothetical protein [candidate division KSB1 bacterium]
MRFKLLSWLAEADRAKIVASRLVEYLRFDRLEGRKHGWPFVIAMAFVAASAALFPTGKSFQFADLKEGEVYEGQQIIAPFTFSIDKTPEEYQRDVRIARESVYPVFVRQDSIAALQTAAIEYFLNDVGRIVEAILPDSMKVRRLREIFATQPRLVISEEGMLFFLRGFSRGERPSASGLRFEAYADQLRRITRDLYAVGLLDVGRSALPPYVQKISVRHGPDEMIESLDQFYTAESVHAAALEKLREIESQSDVATRLAYQILTNFLRPNLFYDEHETQQRISQAEAQVPRARGTVLEKERIIESNDRITKEHLQKLRSLAAEMARRRSSEGGISQLLPTIGRVLVLLLGVGVIGIFLWLSRPKIYEQPLHLLLIALVLFLVIFNAHLVTQFGLSEYLIAVAVAPMLLTVFFDAQVGFAGTVALGIILGGMRAYEFNTIFTTLIV